MTRMLVTATVVLAVTTGCWGPEGGPGGVGQPTGPAPSGSQPAAVAMLGADGVQRVRVSVTDDLTFVPALVRARPGVIEFQLHNGGVTPHSVEVELGSAPRPTSGNINGGQDTKFRVTVARPGAYPYPCLYHLTSGMRGTLEVAGEPVATEPVATAETTRASRRGHPERGQSVLP